MLLRRSVRAIPVLVLVGVLASCGGGDDGDDASSDPTAAPTTAPTPRVTGVSGEIVALSGITMQVQGAGTQTAVTWTDSTTVTATTDATADDVTVGSCVVAFAADDVATTVQISDPADDGCTGTGMPGGGRPSQGQDGWPTDGSRPSPPSGRPADMPTDRPTDLPSGMPDGRRGGVSGGQVTEVTDTTITLSTDDGSTSTLTVGAGTTYTQQVTSDASALVVGQCVQAQGEQDGAGNLTAASLVVSAPTDGGCATGRGPGGFDRPGQDGPGRTGSDD